PGEVISWPLNAPHRVTNLEGMNVSISTVYETEHSDRRKLVYNANRFFRRTCRIPLWSTRETGMSSHIKRSAFKVLQKAGAVADPKSRAYLTQLRIDAAAPDGIQRIRGGPVLTEFSKREFRLADSPIGEAVVVPIDK